MQRTSEVRTRISKPLTSHDLNACISSVQDSAGVGDCAASVVIVAYNTNLDLLRCLDSLQTQSCDSFETLVVDNGRNDAVLGEVFRYPIKYIRLHQNYGPSLARNVGIVAARGEVVCFLDDDGLADCDYVAQHVAAHREGGALGVRGRILPKTDNFYNGLAYHNDLGMAPVPSYIEMEGNASFRRDVLVEVGGFNTDVFHGEGVELSYRVVQRFSEPERLLYWPKAVIYHDYTTGLRKLLRKTLRSAKMKLLLDRQCPGLWQFVEAYHPLPQGEVPRPTNFLRRLQLAALRRALPPFTATAETWYRYRLRRKALA